MKQNIHFRRFLAMLLVLCSLVQYLPIRLQAAETGAENPATGSTTADPQYDTFFDHITLYADGEEAKYVQMDISGHLTLSADFDLGEAAIDTLTWQIYDPNGCQWVPISGASKTELRVGYAMLSSLLGEDGTAVLNCKIISGNALYYSDSILIEPVQAQPEATEPAEEAQPQKAAPAAAPMAEGDDGIIGGELQTHTVTVKYIDYVTQKEVAEPYSATIKHGGDLRVYPASPTVVGYTPYVIQEGGNTANPEFDAADDAAREDIITAYVYTTTDADGKNPVTHYVYGIKTENLTLSLTNITEDMTFCVYYLPNLVSYTVTHYMQNIFDDEYILCFVETLEGYVGQYTAATDLTGASLPDGYPSTLQQGFAALTPFDNIEIAADGTTQVETYYDRQYFLLTFKLDGGFGTEPVYARYGAPVSVTSPTRTGYAFKGWYRLEMERKQVTDKDGNKVWEVQPLPANKTDADGNILKDANGNVLYNYVYTDALGYPLDVAGARLTVAEDGSNLVILVPGTSADDYYYYVPDSGGDPTTTKGNLVPTEALPDTMMAKHAAMIAVWEEVETNVTVVYWLENADHACTEPHTSHPGNTNSDFDYWCSIPLSYKTGFDLKNVVDFLENPLLSVPASTVTTYSTPSFADDEDYSNRKFVIITANSHYQLTTEETVSSSGNVDALKLGESFSTTTPGTPTVWTFVPVSDGAYLLKSGDNYIQLKANASNPSRADMMMTRNSDEAAHFTIAVTPNSNEVAISSGQYSLNYFSTEKTCVGWGSSAPFNLYEVTTTVTADKPGTGASAQILYELATIDVTKLNQASFVLSAYNNTAKMLTATKSDSGLSGSAFNMNATERATEWTFVTAGDGGNTYKIVSGGQYLAIVGSKLTTVSNEANATVFQVTIGIGDDADPKTGIRLYDPVSQQYVNTSQGDSFGIWNVDDNGSTLIPYSYTRKADDPEACYYYYYYYSDLRDLDGTEKSITVDGSGNTIINVYFRRKEYNLRFFYARQTAVGEYQTFYQNIDKFCDLQSSDVDYLLANLENGGRKWVKVELAEGETPEALLNTSFLATFKANKGKTGTYFCAADSCTYYYLTFSARYGADIRNLWPSELLEFAEMNVTEDATTSIKTQIFSAFAGEYWTYYSKNNVNNTVKGLMTQLDKRLLYDSSYVPTASGYDYSDMGTGAVFADNDGFLDFIAYWEKAPGQFLYYIWKELPDYDPTGKVEGTDFVTTLPSPTYDETTATQNYEAVAGQTVYYDDKVGKYYQLYRVINMCDYNPNPVSQQTYPGLVGYEIRSDIFSNMDWDVSKYFYTNVAGTYNPSYLQSRTLNYLYDAIEYSITLHSNGEVLATKDNISYNSMVGAEWIGDEVNGYRNDNMMTVHYPYGLPEGGYEFAGWYKTQDCLDGTMASFERPMPNMDMILYAKWVPKRFDVEIYQTSDREKFVYYINEKTDADGNTVTTHEPMTNYAVDTWIDGNFKDKDGNIIGIPIQVPGTGKGYGEYLRGDVSASGPVTTVDDNGVATIPENMSYKDVAGGTGVIRRQWIFVCWAYLDSDGVEHAIDVSSFQVTGDVKLYAKWTAVGIVNYRVEYVKADLKQKNTGDGYVFEDSDGKEIFYGPDENLYYLNDRKIELDADGKITNKPYTPTGATKVADDTTGRANEGANRTFTAKTGNALDELYRAGYFPLFVSHTVLMETGDKCGCAGDLLVGQCEKHPLVDTFYYVQLTDVPYTVEYLDANGNPLVPKLEVKNPGPRTDDMLKMVVTESYVEKKDYTPDAFQKTLILSANPAANKIVFNYTYNEGTTYHVAHYVQVNAGKPYDKAVEQPDGSCKYYKIHYTLDGQLLKNKDTGLLPDLTVNMMDIPGLEYSYDVIKYYNNVDANGAPLVDKTKTTTRHVETETRTNAGDLASRLQDAEGKTIHNVYVDPDNKVQLTCSYGPHKTHALDDGIYYYTADDGQQYEVRDLENSDGTWTVTFYRLKSEEIVVVGTALGAYGTTVEVYYDFKYYPYFVYHKIHGSTADPLETVIGKALFQSQVKAESWTESQLITKGYPGFTMDSEDKTITMTMTMTIRDNAKEQTINTMTFYYYEKSIAYTYVPMILTTPGLGMNEWSTRVSDDKNAWVTSTGQNIKAATASGNTAPKAVEPLYNTDAYEFVGWFLDQECRQPVAASNLYYEYMGMTSQLGSTENLATHKTILPTRFKGEYQYNELQPNGEYLYKTVQLAGEGLYVGALAVEEGKVQTNVTEQKAVHTNSQTFYALYKPKLGNITITRNIPVADWNQYYSTGSFVYNLKGDTASGTLDMFVTIDPQDFVLSADGQYYTASVVITNVPVNAGTVGYTVTQVAGWSWRYDEEKQEAWVTTNEINKLYHTLTFGEAMTQNNWLSGFAKALENVFGKMP